MPEQQRTAFSRVVDTLEHLARSLVDRFDFHGRRLSRIEDRLAKIDGGADAKEARLIAYEAVNQERRGTGGRPLGFEVRQ